VRLTSLRIDDTEPAALVRPGGAVLLSALNDAFGTSWPTTVQELITAGQVETLRDWVSGADAERLDGLVIPQDQLVYAPLYRRPRKIWGIGLNYVEHAADLSEKAPSTEPASFLKPDTAIIGPGDRTPGAVHIRSGDTAGVQITGFRGLTNPVA
jgi:2-keto-4-pentenoate hydratase/2-oxohepta-3-ene-1,7-dioic acid hydratase in catechol pathway